MTKYIEYVEMRFPDEILTKYDEIVMQGNQMVTWGEAGLFDWLTKLSKEDGWRAVWTCFQPPFIVLEREVISEEVEK